MSIITRRLLLLLLLSALLVCFFRFLPLGKRLHAAIGPKKSITSAYTPALAAKLKTKAAAARAFIRQNRLDKRYCFLIDMSLPSGQNRFFVYDLQTEKVVARSLVAHGRCNEQWLEGRKYGNAVGCGCTSLGRYKTGAAYKGRFGQAYKLHGLDSSNSNAFQRFVVLHAHGCVPAGEVAGDICQSDGCPTVSPAFLAQLQTFFHQSAAPILLWIFE